MILRNFVLCVAVLFLSAVGHTQKLRLATYQYADNNRIANLTPLANLLKEKFGYEVEVKSYPSVQELMRGIREGETDIAFINTFGYLMLQSSGVPYPMKPYLALQVKETIRDNYKTVLVAAATSPIKTMRDVPRYAGQTKLLLVSEGSTSGNLVPRLALAANGIAEPEQLFASVAYGKTHAGTLDAVKNATVGLAAFGSSEYFSFIRSDTFARKLRLIWISPEIPLGPVLIHDQVDAGVRKNILSTCLLLNQKDPAVLESIKNGWSEAKQAERYIGINDSYYQPFRKSLGSDKDLERILKQFAAAQ